MPVVQADSDDGDDLSPLPTKKRLKRDDQRAAEPCQAVRVLPCSASAPGKTSQWGTAAPTSTPTPTLQRKSRLSRIPRSSAAEKNGPQRSTFEAIPVVTKSSSAPAVKANCHGAPTPASHSGMHDTIRSQASSGVADSATTSSVPQTQPSRPSAQTSTQPTLGGRPVSTGATLPCKSAATPFAPTPTNHQARVPCSALHTPHSHYISSHRQTNPPPQPAACSLSTTPQALNPPPPLHTAPTKHATPATPPTPCMHPPQPAAPAVPQRHLSHGMPQPALHRPQPTPSQPRQQASAIHQATCPTSMPAGHQQPQHAQHGSTHTPLQHRGTGTRTSAAPAGVVPRPAPTALSGCGRQVTPADTVQPTLPVQPVRCAPTSHTPCGTEAARGDKLPPPATAPGARVQQHPSHSSAARPPPPSSSMHAVSGPQRAHPERTAGTPAAGCSTMGPGAAACSVQQRAPSTAAQRGPLTPHAAPVLCSAVVAGGSTAAQHGTVPQTRPGVCPQPATLLRAVPTLAAARLHASRASACTGLGGHAVTGALCTHRPSAAHRHSAAPPPQPARQAAPAARPLQPPHPSPTHAYPPSLPQHAQHTQPTPHRPVPQMPAAQPHACTTHASRPLAAAHLQAPPQHKAQHTPQHVPQQSPQLQPPRPSDTRRDGMPAPTSAPARGDPFGLGFSTEAPDPTAHSAAHSTSAQPVHLTAGDPSHAWPTASPVLSSSLHRPPAPAFSSALSLLDPPRPLSSPAQVPRGHLLPPQQQARSAPAVIAPTVPHAGHVAALASSARAAPLPGAHRNLSNSGCGHGCTVPTTAGGFATAGSMVRAGVHGGGTDPTPVHAVACVPHAPGGQAPSRAGRTPEGLRLLASAGAVSDNDENASAAGNAPGIQRSTAVEQPRTGGAAHAAAPAAMHAPLRAAWPRLRVLFADSTADVARLSAAVTAAGTAAAGAAAALRQHRMTAALVLRAGDADLQAIGVAPAAQVAAVRRAAAALCRDPAAAEVSDAERLLLSAPPPRLARSHLPAQLQHPAQSGAQHARHAQHNYHLLATAAAGAGDPDFVDDGDEWQEVRRSTVQTGACSSVGSRKAGSKPPCQLMLRPLQPRRLYSRTAELQTWMVLSRNNPRSSAVALLPDGRRCVRPSQCALLEQGRTATLCGGNGQKCERSVHERQCEAWGVAATGGEVGAGERLCQAILSGEVKHGRKPQPDLMLEQLNMAAVYDQDAHGNLVIVRE
eukprot:jgi/Ulvmu1/11673/UM008_0082.1